MEKKTEKLHEVRGAHQHAQLEVDEHVGSQASRIMGPSEVAESAYRYTETPACLRGRCRCISLEESIKCVGVSNLLHCVRSEFGMCNYFSFAVTVCCVR